MFHEALAFYYPPTKKNSSAFPTNYLFTATAGQTMSSSSSSSEDMSEYFESDSDDTSSEDSELSEGHFEGEEGTVVRGYKLSEMLGHGSYGVVWSAVKASDDTSVALKIGRLEDVSDRETRMLTLVGSHENVIRLFDHFIWDARVVMVVDKMDMDLFTLQRDYDDFDGKDICRQMCRGLQHLHAAGVVHGDLKPENIMVRDKGRGRWLVKLADFGAACTIDGDICDYGQTVAYRSPEMIVGDTTAMRPPADVWSCACIVFEVFCNNVLFDPSASNHYSARSTASHESSLRSNHEQLALMSEILGKFPKRFAKKHREYFNNKGFLKNLGEIKKIDMRVVMIAECDLTPQMASDLYEFLKGMLMYTPRLRSSAEACLQHPFLTAKATVPPNSVAETATKGVEDEPDRHGERGPASTEHK
ncbi:MAG: hypothetical protein CL450_08935 [Acidimicrobiaceae bacterium]|nr:hypothetical protein [Acidimicrobiaceae bacterium]